MRLAESYGAEGIRVERPEEIRPALLKARKYKKGPVMIEFIIDREINVLPMVPPGNSLKDMLLKQEK